MCFAQFEVCFVLKSNLGVIKIYFHTAKFKGGKDNCCVVFWLAKISTKTGWLFYMKYVQDIAHLNIWFHNFSGNKVFFLVDENTHEHCLPNVIANLPDLKEYEILEVEPGEETKSIEVAANLWMSLAELGAERTDVIVNVGGGVVTDLGGFIASTFKRGMPFINVPTSLLAMIDAAQGGKTGIDLGGAKNLVGTFTDAELIFLEASFLKTLPDLQLRSGFAEMMKHGLIADKNHWRNACISYPKINEELIATSAEIKQSIVDEDPKEKGLRKLLNFGHTVGHAIESFMLQNELPILHGEAIAAGMLVEAELSKSLCGLSDEEFSEITLQIDGVFERLPLLSENIDAILEWLKFDKKNKSGELRFSLLEKIGKGVYDIAVPMSDVQVAMSNYISK